MSDNEIDEQSKIFSSALRRALRYELQLDNPQIRIAIMKELEEAAKVIHEINSHMHPPKCTNEGWTGKKEE